MSFGILETIITVLFSALCTSVIFRLFRLPVVLGYFLVGIILGPHSLGFMPNTNSIKGLAEFGIVFLMFTVGLEFSLAKLFSLKKAVFIVGGLQVLLSVLVTILIGMNLGINLISALVLGGVVAMSSTAIVMKQLEDQFELHTTHGLKAFGILLFQDLAVIPFIILIASLSTNNQSSFSSIFLWAILKGIFAIFLIVVLGRWLLRPLFQLIAKTRAIELFTLTVLLITLTAAWLTNFLGLSYSLGAFLAGIMLSETEFRHQIEIEIRPFRDILLGLFFITIGMLVNIGLWGEIWKGILLLVVVIVLGKFILITLINRLMGSSLAVAMRTGLILAQGSEFGFAILTLAMSHQMLPPHYSQVILAALLISIAIAPILIIHNEKIAALFLAKNTNNLKQKNKKIKKLNDHVIICGYGRVGQQIAIVLDRIDVPYLGIDTDPEKINEANFSDRNVIYGDATHPSILDTAGLDRARAIVICFDKVNPTIKVLNMLRQKYSKLPILVRCKDENELKELQKLSATKIIVETFEESLTISNYLLQILKLPSSKIGEIMEKARHQNYKMLRHQ